MFGVIELGMAILEPISIYSEVIGVNIWGELEETNMLFDNLSKEKVFLCDFYEPLPC